MAGRPSSTQERILEFLRGGGVPKSHREVIGATGLSRYAVWNALARMWRGGLVLRTRKPLFEGLRIFKGRGGLSRNTRPYHLYVLRPEGVERLVVGGREFVAYSKRYLDPRGGAGKSKAKLILEFLEENRDGAWFSKEIYEALKGRGVKKGDIMSTARRYEAQGKLYVRGYRSDDGETPFQEGYLIAWLDPEKPREQALAEAIERTNRALEGKASTSPLIRRVHMIKDMVFEASKLRDLVSFNFIHAKLGCSEHEAEGAVERALQLYPELREVKLFNNFRYYYHASMAEEDLKAAMAMKENYIRMVKGRANRVGHNWEAAAEWFMDRFTTGARFWTQNHRNGRMDQRRITIHLVKPVGDRRSNAEVDRVWEVTPGVFAQPITYVLSCKWGLVSKRDLDDFLQTLRWSKEFGVDTPEGRRVKQGVIGIFAGSSFNPKERVKLKDGEEIALTTYAARVNIQLLKAADFNQKLHEHGCPTTITVQKICKVARNEGEVRSLLNAVWANPKQSENTLTEAARRNQDVYDLERRLEGGKP